MEFTGRVSNTDWHPVSNVTFIAKEPTSFLSGNIPEKKCTSIKTKLRTSTAAVTYCLEPRRSTPARESASLENGQKFGVKIYY